MSSQPFNEKSPNLIEFEIDENYIIRFERASKKRANIYIINKQIDSIVASDVQIRITNLQKNVRKKSGIIRETIDELFDVGYISSSFDSIKLKLYQTVSYIVQKWHDSEYITEEELEKEIKESQKKVHYFGVGNVETLQDEVERILTSPNPILEVKKHLDNIIAGEDRTKLLVFILALSGKIKDPKKKTIICALQEAGAGKSWMLENIATLFRVKMDSHLTKKALNYMGKELEDYEILYIKELGNLDMENDSTGNASIKMLSTDDGGLSTTYTLRDPDTGEFKTETVRTDPITVMTSTTRKNVDEQFVRRYWIVSPDASVEQTKRIKQFKIRHNLQELEVLLGKRKYTDYQYSKAVLKCLVENLPTNLNLLVPFWESVYDILDLRNLRIRGDFDKLKLLIYLFGILNYRNLPVVKMELPNGDEKVYHVMTPQRAIDVLRIARESLIYMAKGTEGRDYAMLKVLESMNFEPMTDTSSGSEIGREEIYKLSRVLGWSVRRVKMTLNKFVDLGFMVSKDKPTVYYLTQPLEKIEAELSGYSELDDPEKLREIYDNMVSEGNETLEQIGLDVRFEDDVYVFTTY